MARNLAWGLISGLLLSASGCEQLLDLNHDYTLRTVGIGSAGASGGVADANSAASLATGGQASSGAASRGGSGAASLTANSTGVGATSGSASTHVPASGSGVAGGSTSSGGSSNAQTGGAGGLGMGGVGTSGATVNSTGSVAGRSGATVNSTGGVAGRSGAAVSSAGGVAGRSGAAVSSAGGVAGRSGAMVSSAGGNSSVDTSASRAGGGVGNGGATTGGASGSVVGASSGASSCAACSHAIAYDAGSVTAMHGGNTSTGVTYYAYQDSCTSNEVLVGYAGTLRSDIYELGPKTPVVQLASLIGLCGVVTVAGSGVVTIQPSMALTPRGTDGTTQTFTQVCPSDQVVVGFAGHSGDVIDEIGFVCASLQRLTCGALNLWATNALTPVGGTGGTAYSESCPSGQVAVGHSLYTATNPDHSGEYWVSRFGLQCATPTPLAACDSDS
jgi:hypothetical protein